MIARCGGPGRDGGKGLIDVGLLSVVRLGWRVVGKAFQCKVIVDKSRPFLLRKVAAAKRLALNWPLQ